MMAMTMLRASLYLLLLLFELVLEPWMMTDAKVNLCIYITAIIDKQQTSKIFLFLLQLEHYLSREREYVDCKTH